MRGANGTPVAIFDFGFSEMRLAMSDVAQWRFRITCVLARFPSIWRDARFSPIAMAILAFNPLDMTSDDADDFHIRRGRSRNGGTRAGSRPQTFVKRVESAVRKAGGDPKRIGGGTGKKNGRFNARGRGAKAAATLAGESGEWRRDSGGRFRARCVIVKARAVTRLDWVAVDHHNTGHPHTHVIIRGVTDDGKILNIAGDYIAHGVRQRANELVTRELGHQSEIEIARKLASEVNAERMTRLDKMLLAEQRAEGVVDLRPGQGGSYPARENRHLLISRAKRLERYGLATELSPDAGLWPTKLRRP